jgi:membrane associated rhomboid family serine protease
MAFLQPHAPRQPVFRVPAVVLILIAALVGAHVARTLASEAQSLAWINQYAFIPARYAHAFLSQHGMGLVAQAVPFLTYMFLHNDYTHLAINSLWLFAFGPIVARRFGPVLFLVFFALCGVAGAATHLAFNWGSADPVIGASAAISGLMAAGLRLLPTERPPWADTAPPSEAPMLPLWSRQIILFTLIWAVLNVVAGFTGFGMAGEVGLIAWQAHLGGYFAGLLLSGPFDALRPQTVGHQI